MSSTTGVVDLEVLIPMALEWYGGKIPRVPEGEEESRLISSMEDITWHDEKGLKGYFREPMASFVEANLEALNAFFRGELEAYKKAIQEAVKSGYDYLAANGFVPSEIGAPTSRGLDTFGCKKLARNPAHCRAFGPWAVEVRSIQIGGVGSYLQVPVEYTSIRPYHPAFRDQDSNFRPWPTIGSLGIPPRP